MESAFLNDGVTQGSLIVLQSTPLDWAHLHLLAVFIWMKWGPGRLHA